jgi:hypothetical protein
VRYDLTDFEWSVIEPLLPRSRWCIRPKRNGNIAAEREREIERLHAKNGQLIVERDFLAKRSRR